MPAKAIVPIEAFPCIVSLHRPLSGPWAAWRAGGPRRLGRVVYQQGEDPLCIPHGRATHRGCG